MMRPSPRTSSACAPNSSPPIRPSTRSRPPTASVTAGRHSGVARFPLRAKLALIALVLLVLPWAGWLYVREMERFLLVAQEEALAATARAVATALHERPKLLTYRARSESELRDEAERELRRLTGGVIENEARAREEGADGEIAAILKGLERASSRIWVVSRDYR